MKAQGGASLFCGHISTYIFIDNNNIFIVFRLSNLKRGAGQAVNENQSDHLDILSRSIHVKGVIQVSNSFLSITVKASSTVSILIVCTNLFKPYHSNYKIVLSFLVTKVAC